MGEAKAVSLSQGMMEDLIIRGGLVVDGSGAPARRADVMVSGGLISGIGNYQDAVEAVDARRILDASGMVVAPGFIDCHAHSDLSFLQDDSCASKLYQGITTEISGNCGDSPFPAPPVRRPAEDEWHLASFDRFVRKFEEGGYKMGTHQVMLIGHGTLRADVMGLEDRAPTQDELNQMKTLLRRDLADGAWGMSLGLEYAPGFFADVDELAELGKVVKEFDGFLPCHMRSEGLKIDEALQELIEVGRRSGAHVHVSHLKIDNYKVHGRAREVWERIEAARRSGISITADLYPYTASSTTLSIRCPSWSLEGGAEKLVERLQGERRGEILESIRSHYFNAERAETCLISDDAGYWPEIVGKTLRAVAEELLDTTDYAEAAAEILVRTHGRAWCIFFVMSEADMLYFLSQETAIGSDGSALSGDPGKVSGHPHPRYFGAIDEFFRLNRVHHFCSLEEAVRRVTSLPAGYVGLKRRGLLKAGMAADITVFDPEMIAPRATYQDPVQLSVGVRHVVIDGMVALENGVQKDVRAGRFLRKTEEG